MDLKGKSVLITGGYGDIGRETAFAVAREGANVVLVDRVSLLNGQDLAEKISEAGGEAVYYQADVSDRKAIDYTVDSVCERFEGIDICIGNAAIVKVEPFLEISEANWNQHLSVNLSGCFNIGQAAARAMVSRGRPGRIIFVSSWVQDVPSEDIGAYCVSKSGLKMLAKCMALELGRHHITVNLVAPGFVDAGLSGKLFREKPGLKEQVTRYVPLGYVMSASDVASAIMLLCSPGSDYMTGATLLIDGGNSLFLRSGNA